MAQSASGNVRSQCPYCGVGCGLELIPPALPGQAVKRDAEGNPIWTARGDRQHPSSLGQVCIKGATVGETAASSVAQPTPRTANPSTTGIARAVRRFMPASYSVHPASRGHRGSHQRSVGRTDRPRKSTLPHQELIDTRRCGATLCDRPDDETLASSHVASDEHARN